MTDGAKGDLRQNDIDAQMRVLNNAYAPWGWAFNLAGVDRTVNADWFNDCYANEKPMKNAWSEAITHLLQSPVLPLLAA